MAPMTRTRPQRAAFEQALSGLHHITMLGCAALLLTFAAPTLQWLALAWAVLGWITQSAVAYLVHRFLMHGPSVAARAHALHHRHPGREQLDWLSWFGPIAIIFSAWPVAWLLGAGWPAANAMVAGGCLSYSYFRIIHRLIHSPRPPRWMAGTLAFHQAHHARPDVNFGVTTPLWDWLMETRGADRPLKDLSPRTAQAAQASQTAVAKPDAQQPWAIASRLVRDERDSVFVQLALTAGPLLAGMALLLYAVPVWLCAALALPYWALLYLRFGGPLLLLVHAVAHRRSFTREGRWVERWILWGIPLLYGISPPAYPAHHLAMHHAEGNGSEDVSTTLQYKRDDPWAFLRYYLGFLVFGLLQLGRYLAARRRWRLLRRVVAAELAFWALAGVLLVLAPVPSLVVVVVPYVLTRFFLMAGNWAQHAFVNLKASHDHLGNATVLLNARHNERCFNDGYHAVHHRHPAMHWTEMPQAYERDRLTYAGHGTLVLDGLSNNQVVWWKLMRGDFDGLAKHTLLQDGVPPVLAERATWLRQRARLQVLPGTDLWGRRPQTAPR